MTRALPLPAGEQHIAALQEALSHLGSQTPVIERWAQHLCSVFRRGGRVLAAGNGGSAAQAQHFTAEIVGRYRDDRRGYSALALHADTSSTTAIGNDYGIEEVFARQVDAHGRRGDVLIALSTSGTSANLIKAAQRARGRGMTAWAITGPAPNSLESVCDDAVTVEAPSTATIQECHLVVLHMICSALDCALGVSTRDTPLEVVSR